MSVYRRLIQSTLILHKSSKIEPKVDQKDKEGEDDNNDGEDEEFCNSQGKKRGRKWKSKAKEKSPKKTTPKKNGMNNLVENENSFLHRQFLI
ncbi:hypothetical protein COLO4_35930 [Corchorus olitorius]|uniref:Uncharacterized protein n=1 Tax=Corchorus olitorius TaxID=93759 RepID=A0A1R3GBT6_9ROSI|nr:hypothetical protein COLO4_35930 [Corchorus olitorius]